MADDSADAQASSAATAPHPTSTPVRAIHADAVRHIQRRLAAAAEAPWLHGEVARRMAERLPIIKLQPEHVIDWSGRAGGSEESLAKAYPRARRVAVDPFVLEAAGPAAAAEAPAWWSPSRWLRTAGAGAGPAMLHPSQVAPASAELLWSNMMLHAAIDPPAVLAQWHKAVRVDGFVMFSCLGPDTVRQLRDLYAEAGWGAPTVDFVDMHDIGDMMVHAGFADPVMDQETLTLTWATPEALLAELRTLGGNAAPERHRGLRGRGWLQTLHERLRAQAQRDGRIALTFEVVYGHAFRPAPRARVQGESSIALDDMRAMMRAGAPARR